MRGLIINAKKTQCMIMARGTKKEEEPLTIGGTKLDYVGTYKYLGIIISRNGNIKNMIHDRVEKAKKAIFAVTRALKTTQNVSARLAISIFDKQIQPILTYGCQLWGIPNCNSTIRVRAEGIGNNTKAKINGIMTILGIEKKAIILCRYCKSRDDVLVKLDNLESKITIMKNFSKTPITIHINTEEDDKATEFEKVHSKFCKYVLGISKHSSTTLTYSELGRFPLVNRIAAQCIAYWKRMVNG